MTKKVVNGSQPFLLVLQTNRVNACSVAILPNNKTAKTQPILFLRLIDKKVIQIMKLRVYMTYFFS